MFDFRDLFQWERFITPSIIKLFYWLAVGISVLFGLSHFNHGATFNWRYVLLGSVAGVFYGRAWRDNRQIFAAIVTHTGVDVVWSLWFR